MVFRSIFLVLFAVLLLIKPAEASPRTLKTNSPEETVLNLYRDFAWEAVMAEPAWDGLIDQPAKVLSRYFDDRITSLILRDRACARKNGVCRLDFLPIWASQDPTAADLKIKKSGKPDVVLVRFSYPASDEKVELRYRMTKTRKGWRISDIRGADWSLLSILTSPQE